MSISFFFARICAAGIFFFVLLAQSIILDGRSYFYVVASIIMYFSNNSITPCTALLVLKNSLQFFFPLIFFFTLSFKYIYKKKKNINQKRQPQQRERTVSLFFLIRVKQGEREYNSVIEVQYLPDIKIEANKILLCATFIAIGQRVSIRCCCFIVVVVLFYFFLFCSSISNCRWFFSQWKRCKVCWTPWIVHLLDRFIYYCVENGTDTKPTLYLRYTCTIVYAFVSIVCVIFFEQYHIDFGGR